MSEVSEVKTEAKAAKAKPPRTVITGGRRKMARARAVVKEGRGSIIVNKRPLEVFQPEMLRLKLQEPVLLAGEVAKQIDVDVSVEGGGFMAQAAAARQAIARGIVEWTRSPELRNLFIAYDRSLLVSDPRQTEPHKFSRSSKGARRRKQLSRR